MGRKEVLHRLGMLWFGDLTETSMVLRSLIVDFGEIGAIGSALV